MKTTMYMIGYNNMFAGIRQAGWGCGYVMIPTSYAIIKQWQEECTRKAMDADEENEAYWCKDYFQIGDEEITYTELKTVDGQEYVVIGFDTAHSYNGPHHDFEWVFKTTSELQKAVEAAEAELVSTF